MKLFYENNTARFLFQNIIDLTFPAHMHRGLELFMVEEGEIFITVGNQSQLLEKGDISIAFPNQIHSYCTDKINTGSHGILIICPTELCGDYLSTLLIYHPAVFFRKNGQLHPDILYALHSLLQTRPDIAENIPVIRAYIQLILARLLPELVLIKNRDTQSPGLTAQLITYLSEHYTEAVTLDILAKQLVISKYSISRIFSEKLHTSFSDYINTLRIDYAKLLLQGSDHDILTIGLMSGYENPRTFNRVFKALCGCQPREYRKKRQ